MRLRRRKLEPIVLRGDFVAHDPRTEALVRIAAALERIADQGELRAVPPPLPLPVAPADTLEIPQ